MTAGGRKPTSEPPSGKPPSGDEPVDVEDLFGDLFDDAPPTDPTAPMLGEPGEAPRELDDRQDDERPGEEITVEVPAAAARARASAALEIEQPVAFAPLLPEMDAEIWQAGIQALVSVPDAVDPPPEIPADEWLAEARLLRDESSLADGPARAATLLTAAARAAEIAGQTAEAVVGYDEALARAPSAPDALRARARLAESLGDLDEAHALWARLALASELPDERVFYGALAAEWTLARRGALPAVALDALAAGPARTLALAEEALRGATPGGTAVALAAAGRALGGVVGAAFLEQAARFAVVARDAASAAAYRMAARRLDPDTPESPLARLRAAASADTRTAASRLAELGGELLPGSRLARAVARWGAALARRRGDTATAEAQLSAAGVETAAAARDRIDLDDATAAPLNAAALKRLHAAATSPAVTANLIWVEVGDLVRRGELAGAAALLVSAIEAHPDAVPLALWAEEIAAVTDDPALRAEALDLWLRADPARRAAAGLELAAAREAAGSGLAARAALQTAVESAPEAASFWAAAAADARAGRRGDAARTLEFGADVWEASTLGPALRAVAAAKHAPGDPARALGALGLATDGGLSDAARALGAESLARLAERAGDAAMLAAALEVAGTETADPTQRAWLALRRLSSLAADDPDRAGLLDEALAAAPAHPLALGLAIADPDRAPADAAALLARAGGAADVPAFGRLAALASVSLLALAVDRAGALERASEVAAAWPGDRLARGALVRAARRLGEAGVAPLAALPVAPASPDDVETLTIAEARIDAGDWEGALEALRTIAGGALAAEARRAEARAAGLGAAGLPPGLLFGPPDDAAAAARAGLASLMADAATGRWEKLTSVLAGAPPHELRAGPSTLAFAALVGEGHDVEAAERLAEQAVAATSLPPAAGSGVPALTLARVANGAGETALRLRALALALASLGAAEADRRAAAAIHAARARIQTSVGDPAAALESWRAALALEPTFLPAARALRLAAARAGEASAAAAACEIEAACLLVPEHRVRLLLLAAAIALEAAPPEPERALGFLRAALAIDPAHEAAFERLRALLAELDDLPSLAAALAARVEVAQNPFEITSLRLARAELLAGPLADPNGARAELDAVLRRQPEHPRALERLSDLLLAREAWAEAGDILFQRAVVERDPATLRGIFLRLGEIYSVRVPDPKRAAAAYERVLSVDAANVEALRALSDLYVAEGDGKRALPVTDRLVATESDPMRRQRLRIRLGEILMQTGDLRRAGVELRRAVEDAPRDVGAVTVLAQLLERARDPAGRRSVLDRAVGLLRHDLGRPDGLQLVTLRALAQLLELRDRPHAALAAAQLVAALGAGAKEGARAAARPPRSLVELRRPEVDERAFSSDLPPGIRQLLRLAGPSLRPSGQELAQRLARHGVARTDRRTRGMAPRPIFDTVAGELGVADFELYMKSLPAAAGPIALRAEPGSPPAIILGAPIADLGAAALHFAAGRAVRLLQTHLDAILAVPQEEAGALLVGIIRQSVADYHHPEVRDTLAAAETARVERLIPRKLKQQLMPFAVESAGPFDLSALYAAVRDGANAAGLLAAADLPAALSVILELAGTIVASGPASGPGLTLAAIAANPEARALLRFAVSDEYDDLARVLET